MAELASSQACGEIHQWIKDSFSKREVGHANRASSAPQCVRKRWFQNNGFEGEPLQPRSILVFAFGDVTEHIMKFFIEKSCVGPGKLYSEVNFGKQTGSFVIQHREFTTYEQEEYFVDMGDFKVVFHPDGMGKRNHDGEWELIEIKSSADRGFRDFIKGNFDYLKQAQVGMMATGLNSTRFFYMNKNTSDIFDRLYFSNPTLIEQVKEEFKLTNQDSMPEPSTHPDIGFKKDGSLGWKCSYCDYKQKCFSDLNLTFSKQGRPVWATKE